MSQLIEQRIVKLEKNLRFYRSMLVGILAVAGTLVTFSFTNRAPVPDVVQAKAFQVVDDRGNVLVELKKDGTNGAMSTYTSTGKRLVTLFMADGGGGGINTFDVNDNVIFKVTRTTEGGGYLALFNGARKEVAELGVTDAQGGYLRINDRNSNKMAWITYTQNGGGYFSLSNGDKEMIRLSTPEAGGRMGLYNGLNNRICFLGAQDNKDGNLTIYNSQNTRLGGVPNE